MDVMRNLVSGQGCAVDGTMATRNPLVKFVDTVLDGNARDKGQMGPAGHPRTSFGPGGTALQQPGHMQTAQRGLSEGMAMHFQMSDAHSARVPYMGDLATQNLNPYAQEFMRNASQHRRAPVATAAPLRENMDGWVTEFQQNSHPIRFEEAWREPPRMDSGALSHHQRWINEFRHQTPHHNMPNMEHDRQMESIWEQQRFGPGLADEWAHDFAAENRPELQAAMTEEVKESTRAASSAMAKTLLDSGNPKLQNSEFLQFMNKVSAGEVAFNDNKVVELAENSDRFESAWTDRNSNSEASNKFESAWSTTNGKSLEHVWDSSDISTADHRGIDGALESAWGETEDQDTTYAQFEKAWKEAEKESLYPQELDSAWEHSLQESMSSVWEDAGKEDYEYATENPFLNSVDSFEEGMRLFDAGNIVDAVLAFEADVQQQNGESSEGWRMLGHCHAENDEDRKAIHCLEKAIENDPYNLPALLALGVSYVNELNSQKALATLKAWVEHNPRFQGLQIHLDEYSDGTLMDEVMQLMLQASRFELAGDRTGGDPDVQIVLGVLYNVSKDYDTAADCFKKALSVKPDDYSLWNKLGATLANSNRSEEAIPPYYRALELKPKYARGWLNLGISHANLGKYDEACRCYLQALTLNSEASHIWSYLRIAFTCMERFDLVGKTDTQDVARFAAEFPLFDL